MSAPNFTITLHMVSSLDGRIAKPDNSIAWFETKDHYESGVDQPGAEALTGMVDCYVMGARTYEHALELSKKHGWPYGDVPVIVVTSREFPIERPTIELYSGDLHTLVKELLQPRYKKVWVVGGAKLVSDFLRAGLAHEIRLPILPIILGDGKPFFERLQQEYPLHLKEVTPYKSGMVELWYEIKR